MINDPKEIKEVLNAIDKIKKEDLDKAIGEVDNKLSEEEILKDVVEIVELAKEEIESNDENITATLDLQDLKSLKGLLDLYQKEKEKNKELEKDKKAFVNQYGNMLLKISELEKENREIRDWKYVIDSYEDLDKQKELDLIKIKGKQYIAKDKIKVKIEELEEKINDNNYYKITETEWIQYNYGIKALQSLLEEE